MFGFRFIKFSPTTYVLEYSGGAVKREGAGLAFFYFAPITTLVTVPVGSTDVPFIFTGVTADFQEVTVGQKTHVSARYLLKQKERQERQSSSGIIVSTGLGSTGWMKSILAGAQVITSTKLNPPALTWESPQLFFAVREPFPSRSSGATLVAGYVTRDRPLQITSLWQKTASSSATVSRATFCSLTPGLLPLFNQPTVRVCWS